MSDLKSVPITIVLYFNMLKYYEIPNGAVAHITSAKSAVGGYENQPKDQVMLDFLTQLYPNPCILVLTAALV